jgi:hypothetical protein
MMQKVELHRQIMAAGMPVALRFCSLGTESGDSVEILVVVEGKEP